MAESGVSNIAYFKTRRINDAFKIQNRYHWSWIVFIERGFIP
jgi:hypothetical protein